MNGPSLLPLAAIDELRKRGVQTASFHPDGSIAGIVFFASDNGAAAALAALAAQAGPEGMDVGPMWSETDRAKVLKEHIANARTNEEREAYSRMLAEERASAIAYAGS